eukprot:scaffold27384_cov36-Cyclotella_meneghiniana.AAC.11
MKRDYDQPLKITLVTDHGNREGVDHFVKMIVWSSKDEKGRNVLRHFNLDIDKGGHSMVEAANAIHRSLQSMHLDDIDVEYSYITGDSGGGAKVQLLHPQLVEIGVMPEVSGCMNCILHAFNLAYETACKDSIGDQGMNKNTTFQMIYLAVLMLNTVKKRNNLDHLKKYYSMTMTQLLENEHYIAGATTNFIQAFDELLEVVKESEDDGAAEEIEAELEIDSLLHGSGANSASDEDELITPYDIFAEDEAMQTSEEAASGDTTMVDAGDEDSAAESDDMKMTREELADDCPTNVKEPNFGRWGTISYVAKVVKLHWLPLFYMAQNIKDTEKPNSYLHTVSSKLIELMSAKAHPDDDTPTHYASLQWIVAFGEAFFDDNMDWAKTNDPIFGPGSYGHITRLVPEHLFMMKKQYDALRDGGWKNNPLFNGFSRAVDGVAPRGDLDKCGKEFFERMPELFLQRFEESFSEHTKKWRDRETLPVLIAAGHPLIVKWFCRWLFNHTVTIPSIEIDLYHYAGDQAMKIDLRECIEWLIEKVPEDEYHRIQDDPLIQELIDDLATVAQSEEEIDLLDPATWGDHDFSRAEALIWNAIAPRAAHQQRVENLVQTAAHLGQTHVEEARRSARAKIHCLFYRDYKTWASTIVRQRKKEKMARMEADETTQQKPKKKRRQPNEQRVKVEGKARLELFSKWIDGQLDGIKVARERMGDEAMKKIVAELGKDNKSSAVEQEEAIEQFRRASKSTKSRTVASIHLADVTAWMEGAIILSYLTATNKCKDYIIAELEHRQVKRPKTRIRKKKKKKPVTIQIKEWKDMNEAELRHILRDDERARLQKEEEKVFAKVEEIKSIKPLSSKMKEWMPRQWQIYKQKKGTG